MRFGRVYWTLLAASVAAFLSAAMAIADEPFSSDPQTSLTLVAPQNATSVSIDHQFYELRALPAAIEYASQSIGRVSVPDLNGPATSHGSGTYMGDRIVLTAEHVLRGGNGPAATVDFGDGPIRCVGFLKNKQADQFVLELEREPGVEPVKIAESPPQMGERVYGIGYSGQSGFGVWSGVLSGHMGSTGSQETAEYRGEAAEQGDSGGGVFNERGEYVGTLWGSNANLGFSAAVRYEETRHFLSRSGLIGRIRGKFQGQQGQQCQPGQPCQPQQPIGPSQQPGWPVPGGFSGGQKYPTEPPPSGSASGRQPIPQPIPDSQPNAQQPAPQQPQCPPGCDSIKGCDCPDADDLVGMLKELREPGPRGPQGERGPAGPAGPKGDDGEVTAEQIAVIVSEISKQLRNDPALKGPKGDRGPQGEPGQGITPEMVAAIKQEILAELPDRRVVLVDGESGEVIDDETYAPGEPIVLDFQRIINAAKQR